MRVTSHSDRDLAVWGVPVDVSLAHEQAQWRRQMARLATGHLAGASLRPIRWFYYLAARHSAPPGRPRSCYPGSMNAVAQTRLAVPSLP